MKNGILAFLKRGGEKRPGAGGNGPEIERQGYGDNYTEDKIPKILSKYKDVNSKKRIKRDIYGTEATGPIDAEEQAQINNILDANPMQIDKFAGSGYAKDLMGDVSQMMNQTQPVDPNDPNYGFNGVNRENAFLNAGNSFNNMPMDEQDRIRTIAMRKGLFGDNMQILQPDQILKNLIKGTGSLGQNIKREAGMSYTPGTGFKSYLGTGFNAKDFLSEGDLGSVDIDPTNDWEDKMKGFNIHSHPGQPGEDLTPSDPDRDFSSLWQNSFVVDDKGNTVKYGENPTEDFEVNVPKSMDMKLKMIKKRLRK